MFSLINISVVVRPNYLYLPTYAINTIKTSYSNYKVSKYYSKYIRK